MEFERFRRTGISFVLEYAVDRRYRYLSFQQVAIESGAAERSSVILAVRTDEAPLRTLQLTAGGNVEVVMIQSPELHSTFENSDCDQRRFVLTEAQRTVRVTLAIEDNGARVDLYMPVGLLETWHALGRSQGDFFEIQEQVQSQKQIIRFLASHNPTAINGVRVEGRVTQVSFLDVGEFVLPPNAHPRRLSAWTSRVHVVISYESSVTPETVELQWTLFNASVLSANAMIFANRDCLEIDISSYSPTLEWSAD
jgi:hypothetical protein